MQFCVELNGWFFCQKGNDFECNIGLYFEALRAEDSVSVWSTFRSVDHFENQHGSALRGVIHPGPLQNGHSINREEGNFASQFEAFYLFPFGRCNLNSLGSTVESAKKERKAKLQGCKWQRSSSQSAHKKGSGEKSASSRRNISQLDRF